ncbi:MAG: hypothetical protein DWC11_02625 [Candidatus Poseidoniales archaeon]|nr:MAG: hypothetical protein DWC11_02625 [Candidatus Poseidoniales archaeon]
MQALFVLGLLTVLPGLGLAMWLDAPGGRLRTWCAAPSLGLAAHGGAFGALVLLGLWSFTTACLATLLLQGAGAVLIRRASGQPHSTDRSDWFHAHRSRHRTWIAGGIVGLALLPVFAADVPQGVDWVGFTALAHHLMERGSFSSALGHGWLYPPGLPAVLAFVSHVTGLALPAVGLAVGQFTLAALMLGMMSAMDRHGAGAEAVLAMVLAIGVFSKILDSGWPTVASLALVPACIGLVLDDEGPRWQKRLTLLIGAVVASLIHPSGALILVLLLVADVGCAGLSKGSLGRVRLDVLVLMGLTLLLIGVISLSQDVRLEAPFAEDGWQGGWPMLAYGSPLLFLAGVAGWRLRGHFESRVLVVWMVLIWLLSLVHLLPEGARGPAINNLGAGLYAMGMYAFHLPAAALTALWWSDSTALRTDASSPTLFVVGRDPCAPRPLAVGLVVLVCLGSVLATGAMARLWEHEETLAVAPGDLEVAEHLRIIAGDDPVYAEQAPWGEAMVLAGLNLTVGVDLGVHDGQHQVHLQATQAVLTDDVATLQSLGIAWAISSPYGALGWVLERSSWWETVHEVSGSRAWALRSEPVDGFLGAAKVTDASCASASCVMRPDPWSAQRWNDPHDLGSKRAVIDAPASVNLALLMPPDLPDEPLQVCLHVERLGGLDAAEVQFGAWTADLAGPAGHDRLCGETAPSNEALFSLEDPSSHWINPSGASGRSDRLIDASGLRIHAITFHAASSKA